VKLFDYLSYGRPLVVTDCREQAQVVRGSNAGIVTGDGVEDIARAIEQVAAAPAERVAEWSSNAAEAARAASWSGRAARIVNLLAELR
jgi:glycosyltransferase involved in cell wall biosynthesis